MNIKGMKIGFKSKLHSTTQDHPAMNNFRQTVGRAIVKGASAVFPGIRKGVERANQIRTRGY